MSLIIQLAILVVVILVVFFLLKQIPLPEPAGQIINIVLVVVVALAAIAILSGRGLVL